MGTDRPARQWLRNLQQQKSLRDVHVSYMFHYSIDERSFTFFHHWQEVALPASPAMEHLVDVFQRIRKVAMKKLATTAEEEKSNQEYFEEVCAG